MQMCIMYFYHLCYIAWMQHYWVIVYRPVARRNLPSGADASTWDVLILDEGHKIKNHNTQQYRALLELRSRMRIIITGTPVQNNLLEYHALFSFCAPGLLGDRKAFKQKYVDSIELSQVCRPPARSKCLSYHCQSTLQSFNAVAQGIKTDLKGFLCTLLFKKASAQCSSLQNFLLLAISSG
jgi:SNF2 family DNA or RNA helicase